MEQHLIDTEPATLEQLSADLVLVRFKPNARLSPDGFSQLLAAGRKLPLNHAPGVILVIPEDADFDTRILQMELDTGDSAGDPLRAMSIVTEGGMFEHIARLYFSYHPPGFPFSIFRDLRSATEWMDKRLMGAVP